MNYLGHLYFSNNDTSLMKANLYGDFVKGNKFHHLDPIVEKGIILHRQIDTYIDTHPIVNDLQRQLQGELPKVVAIATDLYFDHLLAREWSKFHSVPLDQFLEKFYTESGNNHYEFAPKFEHLLTKMREHRWINQYSSLEGLDKLCKGVAIRLSFENALTHAQPIFIKHQKIIEKAFFVFMDVANVHLVQLASK
jgi:acyl carrier protein phosphodiesterase